MCCFSRSRALSTLAVAGFGLGLMSGIDVWPSARAQAPLPVRPDTSASGSPLRPPSEAIPVPYGTGVTVDGVIGKTEYASAWQTTLEQGVVLRLVHDGRHLYAALSNLPGRVGWVCLFIAQPNRVRVLHASAQLGSATYEARQMTGPWSPQSTLYEWKHPDRILGEEGWVGNVSPRNNARVRELGVALQRLGLPLGDGAVPASVIPPARVALAYAYVPVARAGARAPQTRVVAWPTTVRDAVRNVKLVEGHNPDGLTFEPATWYLLTRQPR